MTIDGSTRESLTITYYFEEKKWEYVYHTAKRIDNSSNRPSQIENLYNSVDIALSKCEADSILSSWEVGQPYLGLPPLGRDYRGR